MKTQLSKPVRTKASYTDEYKQQALELWRATYERRDWRPADGRTAMRGTK